MATADQLGYEAALELLAEDGRSATTWSTGLEAPLATSEELFQAPAADQLVDRPTADEAEGRDGLSVTASGSADPTGEQAPLLLGLDGGDELFVAPPPAPPSSEDEDLESHLAAETEADGESAELEDLMTAELEGLDLVGHLELEDLEREAFEQEAFEREALELEGPALLGQVAAPGAAAGAVATTVTFSIRTDFAVSAAGRLTFDWIPGEAVAGAEVTILGQPTLRAVTDAGGRARIDVGALADGDHVARLTHATGARATTHPGGPAVADHLGARPARIYRQLDVRIRVRAGGIDSAWVGPADTHGGIGNRTQATTSRRHVPIDWRPVWMRSPMKATERMRAATTIDTIVVHHTGGPKIGPAINTFVNAGTVANAHYLIDRNGHVLKTAEDLRRANHAGTSRWAGRLGVSTPSIGIEVVHRDGPYPAAQMAALLQLIRSLCAAYPTIERHRIVGHSDIATTKGAATLLSDRRSEDPGIEFDWAVLEAEGLGMVPRAVAAVPSILSSFFRGATPTQAVLRRGDHDPSGASPAVLGGRRRPDLTAAPVREVQEDLEHIGYSCRAPGAALGSYDLHTERAVDRFQRHFFAGSRQRLRAGRLGRVDVVTALWLKAVRAGVP